MAVKNAMRRTITICLTIGILLASIKPVGAAVLGPPDGGSSSRGNNQRQEERYIVYEEIWETDWLPSNEWQWTHKVDGSFTGGIHKVGLKWAPGYPKSVDELSHTKTLRYDFIDTTEGTFYIEDDYRDWLRYYYDLVRLERGRVSFRWMCWSRVWYKNVYRRVHWSDRTVDDHLIDTIRSTRDGPGETNPDSVCNWAKYSLVNPYYWSFDEYDEPLKAPPVYVPIPPSGIVPPPVYSGYEAYLGGREIIQDDYKTRDDWGEGGTWLFGGRPVQNVFATSRGKWVWFAIDTRADGDLSLPPARNRVNQVIIRVNGIPGAVGSMYLDSGTPQKGQWMGRVFVPYGTKIGRYRVEFEIRGTNYWGHSRTKIVSAWLQVHGGPTEPPPGCKPWDKDCGRDVGFCGLDEEGMRRLGNKWRYECIDPKLVK